MAKVAKLKGAKILNSFVEWMKSLKSKKLLTEIEIAVEKDDDDKAFNSFTALSDLMGHQKAVDLLSLKARKKIHDMM